MQVIGFCRFSYPAEGGFQIEHETVEDRMSYLYDPARMDSRFAHFEALCLPGLKAQTDTDFTFLILVGDTLPKPYLDRLQALLVDVPQARIVSRPSGPHRKVCAQVINAARRPDRPCLQFRHDDDDAIAVDFVARLRAAAQDAAPLVARERHVAIDFNRGFIGEPTETGLLVAETVTPFWGVALGMSVNAGVTQTIMNFAHNKMQRFMPSLSYTDSLMYLRGHNPHNDSRQGKVAPTVLSPPTPEQDALLAQRFALTSDQIRARFARDNARSRNKV